MSSRRTQFKESLKNACMTNKPYDDVQYSIDIGIPEEEKTYWANNNILESSDSDDIIETSLVEGHNQNKVFISNEKQIADEINGNKEFNQNPILNNSETFELQKTLYENLHENPSLQNNVDNNQTSL